MLFMEHGYHPNMMASGDGALCVCWVGGEIRFTWGHEGETLMMGLVFLQEEEERPELWPFLPQEDTGRRQLSACQEENSHKKQT